MQKLFYLLLPLTLVLNSNNAEEIINFESLENKNNNNTIVNSNKAFFPKEKRFLLEFKPAYFFYQDKNLKDIFGTGTYISIFDISFRLYKKIYSYMESLLQNSRLKLFITFIKDKFNKNIYKKL